MSTPTPDITKTVQLLANINRLTLKAIKSKSAQELIFLILNETVPIVHYDRAVLWELHNNKPTKILGISGQTKIVKTDLSAKWNAIVKGIEEPEKVQVLNTPDLGPETSVLWFPLVSNEKPVLGLWLERWGGIPWKRDEIDILSFLMQSYGAAWEKFAPKYKLKSFFKYRFPFIVALLLLSSLFIRMPLRIVAPCEVVPKDPIIITAPLEGIIEQIAVKPGQMVKKGELLFEYDKRVPLQELRVAQKKVQIVQSEVDRATAQAHKEKKAMAELAVEALKLKKEQLELDLAEFRASQLSVDSPADGVALLDNPEEWHGKPVKIGEKVMIIADPNATKVRFWIAEDDNVPFDFTQPIKVILNVNPGVSRAAKIIYIASFTTLSDKEVPSFVAEAEWDGKPAEDVKLGLKGTVVLYGEKVSVFYWIIRKPWGHLRHILGF